MKIELSYKTISIIIKIIPLHHQQQLQKLGTFCAKHDCCSKEDVLS